jgi:hypothetical protein
VSRSEIYPCKSPAVDVARAGLPGRLKTSACVGFGLPALSDPWNSDSSLGLIYQTGDIAPRDRETRPRRQQPPGPSVATRMPVFGCGRCKH